MVTNKRIVAAVQEGRTLILGCDLGAENFGWGVIDYYGSYITSSMAEIVKGQDRHERALQTMEAFWESQPKARYCLVVNEMPYWDAEKPRVYASQTVLETHLICEGRRRDYGMAFVSLTRGEILSAAGLNTRAGKEAALHAARGHGLGNPRSEHEADALLASWAARHLVIDACMKGGVTL